MSNHIQNYRQRGSPGTGDLRDEFHLSNFDSKTPQKIGSCSGLHVGQAPDFSLNFVESDRFRWIIRGELLDYLAVGAVDEDRRDRSSLQLLESLLEALIQQDGCEVGVLILEKPRGLGECGFILVLEEQRDEG